MIYNVLRSITYELPPLVLFREEIKVAQWKRSEIRNLLYENVVGINFIVRFGILGVRLEDMPAETPYQAYELCTHKPDQRERSINWSVL